MSRVIGDYLQKALELRSQGISFVTVTLVQPQGHVPQDIGAKAIVSSQGLLWGTVGGGRLEAEAIEHAKKILTRLTDSSPTEPFQPEMVQPEMIQYNLQKDFNMVCGGMAALFYECSHSKKWTIAVFGAGHVVQALVPLLTTFDAHVICVDPRKEWLDKLPERENLEKVEMAEPASYVAKLPSQTFYLCITQGHWTDLPVVKEILKRKDAGFLGVIGSVQKASTLKKTLKEEGFSESELEAIHCPVGLPIGSNAPSEIAVSIAAQLLQKR